MGETVTWGEARDLILELGRETGSHLYADLAGLDFAIDRPGVASILHAEWYLNVHRDPKKVREPISLPGAWRPHKPNEDVTPAQRAALARQLERRSVFRTPS